MDLAVIRTPALTPMAPPMAPDLLPPPLSDDDECDTENRATVHSASAASLRVPPTPTPLSTPSPGTGSVVNGLFPAVVAEHPVTPDRPFKQRQYKPHSPTVMGQLLDFVGVPTHLTITDMLVALFKMFLPATATTVLYFSNQTVTMMFVGRQLGTDQLAHYSVGISVFNIFGVSIGQGLATGLDTLCSQAYGRDKRSPEVGLLLQRGIAICTAVALPIMVAFYFIEPLLQAVFGDSLGAGVAVFLRSCPPYLVGLVLNYCLQKTLQAQQVADVPVWANIASAVSCPIFNFYLTSYGVQYAVYGIAASVWIAVLVMALGAAFHPRSIVHLADWPSKKAWSVAGFREFLAVGIPGLLSVIAEWWAFELVITMAAQHGEEVVTAFTVCMNVLTFLFSFPCGMSVAAGVLCGNHLGANDPKGAQAFARMALLCGAVVLLVMDGLLVVFGQHIFALYTHDERVLQKVNGVVYLLAVFHAGDALQTVSQGVFRGVGRQATSARVVILSLWCVGLPLSWFLSYHMSPLHGILLGLCLGFFFENPLLWYDMMARWDWQVLAEIAAIEKEKEEAPQSYVKEEGDPLLHHKSMPSSATPSASPLDSSIANYGAAGTTSV